MLQDLFESKTEVDNHDNLVLIHKIFDYIANAAGKMLLSANKQEFVKTMSIVNKILAFNEEKQKGQGLKILTPNQILSRL